MYQTKQAKQNKNSLSGLLDTAEAIAKGGSNDGTDHAPAIGLVQDLRKFVDEQGGGKGAKPLKMDVYITTTDGFNLKIANSPEINAVIKQGISNAFSDGASGVSK